MRKDKLLIVTLDNGSIRKTKTNKNFKWMNTICYSSHLRMCFVFKFLVRQLQCEVIESQWLEDHVGIKWNIYKHYVTVYQKKLMLFKEPYQKN